jgi:peptide/nickel transport system permease protein
MTSVELSEVAIAETPEVSPRRKRLSIGVSLAIAWLVVVAFYAVFASLLPHVGDPYAIDPLHPYAPPSAQHWFGTDELGRDLFTRCVYGARLTFLVTLSALGIAIVVGGMLGLAAGFYRGSIDHVIMACTEISLAFPGLILLLAILAFLGDSIRNVIIALAIFVTPGLIRVVRAGTIQFSERPFVTASRTLGASNFRIMFREIFPNIAPALVAISLLILSVLIIAEGGLSFLGLGVPPPHPTWGGIIASGINVLKESPHVTMVPSLVLFATVLSFNMLGEEIRRRFDNREARI